MKRQNLTILLTIFLSMIGLNTLAHDIEVENNDGVTLYYNYTNDGTELAVTFRGTSYYEYPDEYTGNVVIPEEVTYMNTTRKVTSIGEGAFRICSGLTSIEIPNSVKSIGDYAFFNCTSLTSISIPNSVTSIGNNAFYSCSGLTSIEIPNSVTSIGNNAFQYCSKLTSFTIPNSVTSIGSEAFYGCSGITTFTIPNSVMSIGSSAFAACAGLIKVIVSDIAAWCGIAFGNDLANPLKFAHHLYSDENTEITDLVIPIGVTSIGNWAFYECTDLTSVTIPNSVTSIGNNAFYSCSGLTSVTIPSSVTSIEDYAFSQCSGLTTISIPSSVTSIEDYAFSQCSGLTTISIPSSVTSIKEGAFSQCSGITSITIPNSVTSIGRHAFKNCSGLTSVSIPNSVTSIGWYAFSGCTLLDKVQTYNNTPITAYSVSFPNRANEVLYVPAGSKTAYESAEECWNEFKEIVEMPSEVGITIGETGIGTYCSEYSLDFTGSDVKAYVVSSFDSGSGQVTMNRVYKTTPNTGLVIKGSTGNYDISLGDGGSTASNMLVGVTENTVLNKVVGDYTNYILAKKGGEVGFYAVSNGSTLKANKAYLPLKTADLPASARIAFFFDDEETTDIKAVEEQQIFNVQDDVIIYNLNGQRMTSLQKGLNIVNGKKVIIK